MNRMKILGLALVAMFAITAVAATSALAELSHTYSVAGKELKAGETKEITAKDSEEFTLKGKGALEAEAVTKCKKLKLKASEHPEIIGGVPGTSAKEVIEFEECSARIKSLLGEATCKSAEVSNASTTNELVTVVKPEALKGQLAARFVPTTGKLFSTVKLKECGALGSQKAEVEGTTAALIPETAEAVEGKLVWNEKSEITEVENQKKEKVKVGLESDKKLATLNGAASVSLVSGQDWSAV
jgi:hypothetical protein